MPSLPVSDAPKHSKFTQRRRGGETQRFRVSRVIHLCRGRMSREILLDRNRRAKPLCVAARTSPTVEWVHAEARRRGGTAVPAPFFHRRRTHDAAGADLHRPTSKNAIPSASPRLRVNQNGVHAEKWFAQRR